MKNDEIQVALLNNYAAFISFIDVLNQQEFEWAPAGKWSAGQQLDHLIRSTAPLANGLWFPKYVLKLTFGKANRPSKSYDGLVEKYHAKLSTGGKASGRFIPKPVLFNEKTGKSRKLISIIQKLNKQVGLFSEHQLDEYILPHPLLGKVTIREMLYFTIYHAGHHRNLIRSYLALKENGQ